MTKLRNIALLLLAAAFTGGCTLQSSFGYAACVAPCTRDFNRAQFLEDVRRSGFEATRTHVLITDSGEAIAVSDPIDTAVATTAYAVRLPSP
jgi:hypothetical protein